MERWCVPALKCRAIFGLPLRGADNIRLMFCEAELNVSASVDDEPVNNTANRRRDD